MKYNACIQILSSRTKCLEKYLRTLYKFYNNKYDYPVYIYYFDDIYDSPGYRKKIHEGISPNIHFISIPYKTPEHIKEQDLFYNNKKLWYARTRFSIARKGYLHMCHFYNNLYKYPNTKFHEYDYVMCNDDDMGYVKELPNDPIEVMANRAEDIGSCNISRPLKNHKISQGHLDTRFGLWSFAKSFIVENDIEPKSQELKDLLLDPKGEVNFHFLPWGCAYVFKPKIFENDLWKKWISAVNKNGGIYKYRWGDMEIIGLFYYMYSSKPIYDLRYKKDGYLVSGLFKTIEPNAPNIKHPER